MSLDVVVVSTAYKDGPKLERCRESVRRQSLHARHVTRTSDTGEALENLHHVVSRLDPSAIVIWLDGDDFLACSHAIYEVLHTYNISDAWMTYGSYVRGDGTLGHCRKFFPWEASFPRKTDWIWSHLRTFRAGLAQKVRVEHLMMSPLLSQKPVPASVDRVWAEPTDCAMIWPMVEMAGSKNIAYIETPLVIYDTEHAHGRSPEEAAKEGQAVEFLRNLTPYSPLKERPW